MPFEPSSFQKAIFEFIQNPQGGNAIIKAVAGSGKSTTLVKGAELTSGSAIFLAFNKSIAEALKAKLPAHFQARTFHSLCYGPVTKMIGVRTVNDRKIDGIIRSTLSEGDAKLYGSFIRKLVGLARNAGLGALSPLTSEAMFALVEQHDIVLESEAADEGHGIALAIDTLEISNGGHEVDFDDLLYFAVLKGIRLPSFDWVFVDEAQDTNAIQRAILRKILARGGRLVAVGDSAQSIYGFRGADSSAMELIAEEFAPCTSLPLSVTYRCGTAITAAAQRYVPEILSAPGAIEGEVLSKETAWKLEELGQHDLVVCRNTKPLIDLGFRLMRARIPLRILGRDIGEGLKSLIRKCAGGRDSVDRFLERLEAWRSREVEKAIAKGLEAKAEAIEDKAGTLVLLASELPESRRTVSELVSILDTLFTDQNSRITLSTIHKAKGLEADTVWWLAPSLCPSRWAKQDWQKQQEANLMYVATTRAAKRLVLIELPKKGETK